MFAKGVVAERVLALARRFPETRALLEAYARVVDDLCDAETCPLRLEHDALFHCIAHAVAEYAEKTMTSAQRELNTSTERLFLSPFLSGRSKELELKRVHSAEELIARLQSKEACARCLNEEGILHSGRCDQWVGWDCYK